MLELEELVYGADWPDDIEVNGKVVWRADGAFADLYLMNRVVGWEIGITPDGFKWLEDELKDAKTIIVYPTRVANSIQKNIQRQYPDAASMTLYEHDKIDVANDIEQLEDTIENRIFRLPVDKSYILPFTGFCYATMVARDFMIERKMKYKLLLFDSFTHTHHEVKDVVGKL